MEKRAMNGEGACLYNNRPGVVVSCAPRLQFLESNISTALAPLGSPRSSQPASSLGSARNGAHVHTKNDAQTVGRGRTSILGSRAHELLSEQD